jgi:regulator of extracellular matrix RemA (YlzA/DUF370 family)
MQKLVTAGYAKNTQAIILEWVKPHIVMLLQPERVEARNSEGKHHE